MSEAVDLEAVKQIQQKVWSEGDFAMIGGAQVLAGELLCERLDVMPDERCLDVACGAGNTTLAAARRAWGNTVGIDYVPALLARARERAAAERLNVDFLEGDAENLSFDDGEFDVVTSTFGAMFAPNQQRAADELVRVFGDRISDLSLERRTMAMRFRSFEHWLDFFRTYFGPMKMAFARVGAEGEAAFTDDLRALVERYDRGGERAMVVGADYLEVVAVRA